MVTVTRYLPHQLSGDCPTTIGIASGQRKYAVDTSEPHFSSVRYAKSERLGQLPIRSVQLPSPCREARPCPRNCPAIASRPACTAQSRPRLSSLEAGWPVSAISDDHPGFDAAPAELLFGSEMMQICCEIDWRDSETVCKHIPIQNKRE